MKNAVKIFLCTILCLVVITLTQSVTFAGVWDIEKSVLVGLWDAPLDWIGTVAFWKYVVVALSVVGVIVMAVVSLIRLGLNKRKMKHRKHKSDSKPIEPKKANNAANGVVISSVSKTSSPSKFTRVTPKE